MTSISQTHLRRPETRQGPKVLGPESSALPETDHQQLRRHLDQCETTRRPGWALLANVLRHKAMKTQPVRDLHDSDLATGGSHVTFCVDNGHQQTGLLSHQARTGLASGVIPVSSLLGATLIGMRVGQRAPLLFDDGSIGTVTVLGVAQPV